MTRSNWAGGHPNPDNPEYGSCGFMNNEAQFESASCSYQRPFVCKAEFYDDLLSQSVGSTRGEIVGCDYGWTLLGGHCVKLFTEGKTYADARQSCLFEKSHLVSIHSANYNAYIKGSNFLN